MSDLQRRTVVRQGRRGQRAVRQDVRGVVGPDERKFEKDRAEITQTIKNLEDKLKPVSSSTIQLLATELSKQSAELAELEKVKEANAIEIKATDTKIREIGVEYKEKKMVANDHLAGVRHKNESRHDDAVERLEQQFLIRRCSSSEERKFKQEIVALKKSKERLIEYNAAKVIVDAFKKEQEDLRTHRDTLYRKNKELRGRELAQRDAVAKLKQELEEAKERKKVGITEKEDLKKEIDILYKQRKQLYDKFRSEQLAFSELLRQQNEEEMAKRDASRATREAKRKYRVIEQTFEREQQYIDRISTCNALISHLHRLYTSAPNHTGATPPDQDQDHSPVGSAINLDSTPMRSQSAPVSKEAGFILRRERDEVLVPTTVMLTRKRSKKDKKRNVMVQRRLNLNPILFKQFDSLGLGPPSTLLDIPQVLSLLQDKLAYFEGMTKNQESLSLLELTVDSGLGSTAPSEMLDPVDRDADFSNSQEEMNLDPGLGTSTTISPKRSHPDVALPPQRSATDHMIPSKKEEPMREAVSDHALVQDSDNILPHNLVSMASSSTTGASGTCIAVEGGEE